MMFGMKTLHIYCYSGSFQEKSFFNLIVMLGVFFSLEWLFHESQMVTTIGVMKPLMDNNTYFHPNMDMIIGTLTKSSRLYAFVGMIMEFHPCKNDGMFNIWF